MWYDSKPVVRFDGAQAGQGCTCARNGEEMIQKDRPIVEYCRRREMLKVAAVQEIRQGWP
jgi:hypothetical protein